MDMTEDILTQARVSMQNWYYACQRSSNWKKGPVVNIEGAFSDSKQELEPCMWGVDEFGRKYLTIQLHIPEKQESTICIVYESHPSVVLNAWSTITQGEIQIQLDEVDIDQLFRDQCVTTRDDLFLLTDSTGTIGFEFM